MNQNTWMLSRTLDETRMKPWTLPADAKHAEIQSCRLEAVVNGFAPISLPEMDSVALLNRIDTKYVLRIDQLVRALAALQQDYRALSVNGQQMNHYRTLYFDTPDFALFNLHVNERAERYKVRSREYLETKESYLEVKHHTRTDRTVKSRIHTAQPAMWIDAGAERWLKDVYPFDGRELESKLWNTFRRITLVDRVNCERVTLDVDLAFYTARRIVQLDGIVVAEVKRNGHACSSPFEGQMRALHIRPQGFSKYCIGTALLYDNIKKNSLKAKLLWLEKNSLGVHHE